MLHSIVKHFVATLLFILTISSYAKSQDTLMTRRWYQPDFVPLQYAGNIGFLSTGIGITSNNQKYELALLYGYVPASIAKNPIHAITAKNIFPLASYFLRSNQSLLPYLGVAVSLEVSGNSFLRLPSQYPRSYYDFPKAIHATAFGGVKLQYMFEQDLAYLRGLEFYTEAGTVDVYLWYKTISEEIKFRQIFSLALGVHFLLR